MNFVSFRFLIEKFADDFRVEEFYIAPAAKGGDEAVADSVYASSGKYIDPVCFAHLPCFFHVQPSGVFVGGKSKRYGFSKKRTSHFYCDVGCLEHILPFLHVRPDS